MKDRNEDRRIIRTRLAIREALIGLIAERGFDPLTVKDISEKANINRGTFYLHYRDKFDLLEQTIDQIAEECKNIILEVNTLDLSDYKDLDEPIPVMVSLFDFFQKNAALMRALLGLKGDMAFRNHLEKVLWTSFFEKELLTHIKRANFLIPSEYFMAYLISAHLGVVQQWLENGCRETPREMAFILYRLSFHGLFQAAGLDKLQL